VTGERGANSCGYSLKNHRFLDGTFCNRSAVFAITPYCELKMNKRDVTDDEILELMERPISQHRAGNVSGRREIEAKLGDHVFTVIYRPLVFFNPGGDRRERMGSCPCRKMQPGTGRWKKYRAEGRGLKP
jgi:hypothetical protein